MKIAQTMQNSSNFIVRKSSVLQTEREISYSNLETRS